MGPSYHLYAKTEEKAMGRAVMMMRVQGGESRQVAQDVVAKLKDRFNADDEAQVDLLFNPDDRTEFQIQGKWRDVDTARKAVASFEKVVGDLSGAKVEIALKTVFTSKPL